MLPVSSSFWIVQLYLKFESFPVPQFLLSFSLFVVTFIDLFSYLCLLIELFHKCSSLSNEKRDERISYYEEQVNFWSWSHGSWILYTMYHVPNAGSDSFSRMRPLSQWVMYANKESLGQIQHSKQTQKCFFSGNVLYKVIQRLPRCLHLW